MNPALVKVSVSETEFHILSNVHMRKDRIVLKHHSNISPGRIQIIDPCVIEIKISAFNAVESGNHPQQCRLSAAGGTQQCKKFASANIQ